MGARSRREKSAFWPSLWASNGSLSSSTIFQQESQRKQKFTGQMEFTRTCGGLFHR